MRLFGMASMELLFALPFPTCLSPSRTALPRFSPSINLPFPYCLRPPRLPSPDTLPTPSRRLTVLSYSCDGVSIDLPPNELKLQLEALQTEAEQVRARANTARARFMRLTEIVENLRVRAALDVNSGREERAIQSLEEKQKVMKALAKSKQRAELLDELSVKLGEAISRKETQLIRALSSAQLKMDDGRSSVTNVRIVSPKEEVVPGLKSIDTEEIGTIKQNGEEDSCNSVIHGAPEICVESRTSDADCLSNDSGDEIVDSSDDADLTQLAGPDMFPTFLSRIDDQLTDIEMELSDFMNVAAMILPEAIGNIENKKVACVKQIWQDIRDTRARIQMIIEQK